MGRRIKVGNGSTNTSTNEQEQQTGTGGTETVERGNTKNGTAGETGRAGGKTGGSGTTGGTTTEEKRDTGIPRPSVLEQGKPKKVSVTIPETGEKVEPAKKKRTRKSTKKEADATEIINFLNAINAIIPTQSAVGVLKLSEKEIENIAQPLANILDKNGIGEKIAEKSDGIALVTAITMAYAPRAFFVINTLQQKKKQEELKNAITTNSTETNETRKIQTPSDENARTDGNAVHGGTNGNGILDILPPTVG